MAQLVDNVTWAWIGGPGDKLVQMGDMLDRGPQDKDVMDTILRLQRESAAAGSEMVVILGNHELMNIQGQTHYVSKESFESFGGKHSHSRQFAPDGEYGAWIRTLPLTHVDMRTLFVHAGLLPEYARRGLDTLEAQAKAEVQLGDQNAAKRQRSGEDDVLGVHGPVWTRKLVTRAQNGDCRLVRESLAILDLDRMVVGHTPQSDGNLGSFCDSQLIVVDVGMSKWMYGHLALLEMSDTGANGDIELREIVPHTKILEEEAAAQKDAEAAAQSDSVDDELRRDPVRLQEIFETMRQAEKWNDVNEEL